MPQALPALEVMIVLSRGTLVCGLAQKPSWGSGMGGNFREAILSIPLPPWGSLSLPDLGLLIQSQGPLLCPFL